MKMATLKTRLKKSVPVVGLLVALGGVSAVPCAVASESDDLAAMVQHFLANAHEEAAHAAFWADDLIYTSSAGLRFGKGEIMDGFRGSEDDAAEDGNSEPAISYSGEEFDVRVHGDTAIVAFRLVGTPADGSDKLGYFNTGTLLKRDGEWRVIAWQATRIPPR